MARESGTGPVSDALAALIRGRIKSYDPPWTVDDLADHTEGTVTRKTMQTRMTTVRAKARSFDADELHAIAKALGTTASDLVATAEKMVAANPRLPRADS